MLERVSQSDHEIWSARKAIAETKRYIVIVKQPLNWVVLQRVTHIDIVANRRRGRVLIVRLLSRTKHILPKACLTQGLITDATSNVERDPRTLLLDGSGRASERDKGTLSQSLEWILWLSKHSAVLLNQAPPKAFTW